MDASIDKLRKIRDLIAGERTSRLNRSNQIERPGSSEGVTKVESDAPQPSRNATNLAPAHRTLQSSAAESAAMVTIIKLNYAEQEIAFRTER